MSEKPRPNSQPSREDLEKTLSFPPPKAKNPCSILDFCPSSAAELSLWLEMLPFEQFEVVWVQTIAWCKLEGETTNLIRTLNVVRQKYREHNKTAGA